MCFLTPTKQRARGLTARHSELILQLVLWPAVGTCLLRRQVSGNWLSITVEGLAREIADSILAVSNFFASSSPTYFIADDQAKALRVNDSQLGLGPELKWVSEVVANILIVPTKTDDALGSMHAAPVRRFRPNHVSMAIQ